MNYTLYIDESGDFETQRGQWVLSGALFADTYENCEKLLINKLSSVPKQLGCESIKDFHLTEFRQAHGHKTAVSMAQTFLDKLNILPFNYHFLSTINYTKSSLSEREKTYRLMVSDLLALCETVIPENDIIEHLDLVIATRTIDGERQTWESDVDKDILQSLPKALEMDLATKGMVELIGNHIQVKLQQANKSWGLVCADFIANLTYNNRNQNEKELFESLRKQNKYSLCESCGGYEGRRANIAERDQDYVLSLYRWLVLSLKKKEQENAHNAIQRLFKKVFIQRGTSGHRTAFEALLERLWRNYNSPHLYQQLSDILLFLEDELEIFFSESQGMQNAIIFRIRNFTMMLENHIGNAERLNVLVDKQNGDIGKLASNPEYFNMILDFKTHEIETKINNLELEKGYALATKYTEMIKNYKECWKLLTEQDELDLFDSSRANIKSEMILIRSEVLVSGIAHKRLTDNIDDKVNEILKLISHPLDISRLNNYKIMYLLRQRKHEEAMRFSLSLFPLIETDLLNFFDLLWFMKVLNDSILAGEITKFQKYIVIVNFQFSQLKIEDKGHPIDLLWRELALFEFVVKNDKKAALKNIKHSKSSFTLGNSAIAHWLKIVVGIHEDYFLDKLKSEREYFINFKNNELIEAMDNLDDMNVLEKVRYISPY
jgi:hypothetical protein